MPTYKSRRSGVDLRTLFPPSRPKMQPIIVEQAVCLEYGHCWSACHPYYDKHYRTKKEALAAARKIRDKLARKWGASVPRPKCEAP